MDKVLRKKFGHTKSRRKRARRKSNRRLKISLKMIINKAQRKSPAVRKRVTTKRSQEEKKPKKRVILGQYLNQEISKTIKIVNRNQKERTKVLLKERRKGVRRERANRKKMTISRCGCLTKRQNLRKTKTTN